MNEKGKLKHRVHLMVFRRGETAGKDVLMEHVVTHEARFWSTWRKMYRRYYCEMADEVQYVGWAFTEPYWREHGMAGRNTS